MENVEIQVAIFPLVVGFLIQKVRLVSTRLQYIVSMGIIALPHIWSCHRWLAVLLQLLTVRPINTIYQFAHGLYTLTSTEPPPFKPNRKWLNICIWSLDRILTSTTVLGQSGTGSNGWKEVFYIPQCYRTVATPLDGVSRTLVGWGSLITLQRRSLRVI